MERTKGTSETAIVTAVNGPVIRVRRAAGLSMNEMVIIGREQLIGEVVEFHGDTATIQVYENTTGLRVGAEVEGQGMPLFVELGPGLVSHVFDGTQRTLSVLFEHTGPWVKRGKTAHALDRERPWAFSPTVRTGERVTPGQVLGEVVETPCVAHRVMVPPGCGGTVVEIAPQGAYTLDERIVLTEDAGGTRHPVHLYHRWPVRRMRPCLRRIPPADPLFTGQRVVDFFFPLTKGGTAAIPRGFGTGKTIT